MRYGVSVKTGDRKLIGVQWNKAIGGDAAETGSGAGSYDIRQSVWHVNVSTILTLSFPIADKLCSAAALGSMAVADGVSSMPCSAGKTPLPMDP